MAEIKQQEAIENNSELLAQFLTAVNEDQNLNFLKEYQDFDIASILESVNVEHRLAIIETVSVESYWAILKYLQYETAKHIHTSLSDELVNQRLSCITETDVIAFSDFLPNDFVDEYLLTQSEETITLIQQALSYEDNKVGRYTVPSFLVANAQNSVGRIKNEIKKRASTPIKAIIVHNKNEIVGVVDPSMLLIYKDESKLKEIAVITPILEDTQNIDDVSKQISLDGNVLWFPVLSEGKIMGVISIATITVTLRELSLQAVVQENVKSEDDLFTPISVAARLRALWLVINLITAFAASAIISIFDSTVEQVVALAVLMPVVASMGGIAGSQTLAVSLRGIALNYLHQSNLKLLVNKELKIATFNGLIMGLLISVPVYLIFDSWVLALVIYCAILVNSFAAAFSGTIIPFILNKFNIDPAIAGSVVLTTITDVVGFLVFLGLGTLFLV